MSSEFAVAEFWWPFVGRLRDQVNLEKSGQAELDSWNLLATTRISSPYQQVWLNAKVEPFVWDLTTLQLGLNHLYGT